MNTIIIHSNERTVKKCGELLYQQVSRDKVHLVSDKPFAMSLKRAYELALTFSEKWFIIIAGDQYILPEVVKGFEAEIELNPDVFRISGRGYDKLWMDTRLLAPCVYNTSYLKEALSIDFLKQIRPETYVIQKLDIPYILKRNFVTSMHDFNQYYSDIYRKGVFQNDKNVNYINEIIEKLESSEDMDHKIFLEGILGNLNFKQSMGKYNLTEKQPLNE